MIAGFTQSEASAADQPQVSILIPSWNNLGQLKLCLEGIAEHSALPHQVIVHVNEGKDGTADWLESQQVEYTFSAENIGICTALNRAYTKARADYIIYLNDDMFVLPDWDRHLLEALDQVDPDTPAYASGTMIQPYSICSSAIVADYGNDVDAFERDRLLKDLQAGVFERDDWSGATWPPSCVHRRWWDLVHGYSEEFSPGFYSDIDFSMKLWHSGCRRFHGVSRSLVYHFGEQSTKRIRGPKGKTVKRTRIQFLQKWGILPSTAVRYFLRSGEAFQDVLPEPELRVEYARLKLLSAYYSGHQISRDLLDYFGWTSEPAESSKPACR